MKKIFGILLMVCTFVFVGHILFADQMSQEDCDKKKEGWYITGLPLINFSSDTGVGYGVRLYLYYNGERGQDYFCTTPYLTQIYAQFFQTTNDYYYHELHWDQFNLFGTDFRIQAALVYEGNSNANYFGIGGDTTRGHLTDYYGNVYGSYSDYREDFLVGTGIDREFYKFNTYKFIRPKFTLDLYGQIMANLNYIVGVKFSWVDITTWNGSSFELNGNKHRSQYTLLALEEPRGFAGGWVNTLRFGVAYNTLDFEPDPKSGMNIDYSLEMSQSFFGSDYRFYRSTFGARYFITFFDRLTLASRLAYTSAWEDVPFYDMSEFSFPFDRQSGLGGNRTLRGYKDDRFVGRTMTLVNLEARVKVWEITGYGQRFEFKLIAFWDAGNVYDLAGDPFAHPRWDDYRHDIGGGLVIAWNQATIIHFYYAWSMEDSGIYVNFNHAIR